jgi:hypothetical protein
MQPSSANDVKQEEGEEEGGDQSVRSPLLAKLMTLVDAAGRLTLATREDVTTLHDFGRGFPFFRFAGVTAFVSTSPSFVNVDAFALFDDCPLEVVDAVLRSKFHSKRMYNSLIDGIAKHVDTIHTLPFSFFDAVWDIARFDDALPVQWWELCEAHPAMAARVRLADDVVDILRRREECEADDSWLNRSCPVMREITKLVDYDAVHEGGPRMTAVAKQQADVRAAFHSQSSV